MRTALETKCSDPQWMWRIGYKNRSPARLSLTSQAKCTELLRAEVRNLHSAPLCRIKEMYWSRKYGKTIKIKQQITESQALVTKLKK